MELDLRNITRVNAAWLDEDHTFKKRPPQGGSWRYYRIVIDGTCSGCSKHPVAGRHREYLREAYRTKTDANNRITEIMVDAKRGDIDIHTPSDITIAEWSETWRRDYLGKITKLTRQSYEATIEKHILPALGHVRLRDLDHTKVNAFYADLEARGYKASSIGRYHTVLASMVKAAAKPSVGLLSRTPFDGRNNDIALPKTVRKRSIDKERHALSDSETRLLLDSLRDDAPLEVPVALALLAGLRAQEVLALRWRDVSFDRKIISVYEAIEETRDENGALALRFKQPKSTHGVRDIPLDDELAEVLSRWRAARAEIDLACVAPTALVFPEDDPAHIGDTPNTSDPMARSRLSNRWLKWKTRKENKTVFGDVRFHDLRHSAASFWLNNGISMFKVSRWLGHANIKITVDIYGHERPDSDDADLVSELRRTRQGGERGQVVDLADAAGER